MNRLAQGALFLAVLTGFVATLRWINTDRRPCFDVIPPGLCRLP